MKAFFVHDEKKQADLMVLPDTDYLVTVNRNVIEEFIAVEPDFSKYSGERLNDLLPESLGVVVATRKTDGDVCVIEQGLWHQRMAFYLDGPG